MCGRVSACVCACMWRGRCVWMYYQYFHEGRSLLLSPCEKILLFDGETSICVRPSTNNF